MAEKKKLKKIKTYLGKVQINEIKADIEEHTKMLRANERGDIQLQDPREMAGYIKKREAQLSRGVPTQLKGAAANKAFAYAKQLKKQIIENMPRSAHLRFPKTNDKDQDIDNPEKIHDFERSVREAMKWQKTRVALPGYHPIHPIQLYHHLMKRVDPSAPREDFSRHEREKC